MSRKMYGYTALLATGLLAATLAGCGSDKKGSVASTSGGVATVGDTACFQCHAATADPLTGETIIAQYQRSKHAELGCESCHGGGAQHNGVGPLPFAKPEATRCATCHDGTTAPLTNSPKYETSKHAEQSVRTGDICYRCHSHEGAVLSDLNGYTGDATFLKDSANKLFQDRDFTQFGGIKCATCHEHGGGLRSVKTKVAGNLVPFDPNANNKLDQFDLCTSCHNLTTGTGTATTLADHYHRGGSSIRLGRVITDTHFDNPATGVGTSGVDGTKIEGYVVRTTGANPCADCHGLHDVMVQPTSGSSVQQQWARSAHAGKILQLKEDFVFANFSSTADGDLNKSHRTAANIDAVTAVATTPESAAGWEHYDWDNSSGDTSDRKSCQRCHTATGLVNYLNTQANDTVYNAANNSFTHLYGWTATNKKSPQNEVLYCWGCHSDAGAGTLRNPGAITVNYSNSATVTFPDWKGSNVCMACHTGRENGDSITNSTGDFANLGFLNSHYLTAGGTINNTSGYHFNGKTYNNVPFYKHNLIGVSAAGTGSNGPCVGCHMTSGEKHLFTNVAKDGSGVITAITSAACATCHTGAYALTPAKLILEEEEYKTALFALQKAIEAKGIYFANANPYFFIDTNANGVLEAGETVRANAFKNWEGALAAADTGKPTMGAAFNLNMLKHDPGGYAHNRFYAKQLIYDSIDYINDGILNKDVAATINALSVLTVQQKADAIAYVVNGEAGVETLGLR